MVSPLSGSIANTINKAFKNIFLDATLTRDGANSGSVYDPTVAAPTVYTCKAIAQDDGEGTQGNNLENATYTSILILAKSFRLNGVSVAVTPLPLDRIAIASQDVNGVLSGGPEAKKAITSDPAGATWLVRVVT